MSDFIIENDKQPNYVRDLKIIDNELNEKTYKHYGRSSLFLAQKGLKLGNKRNEILNKFVKIGDILIDKNLNPKLQKTANNKNASIKLNNGISIDFSNNTLVGGQTKSYLYRKENEAYLYEGNDKVIIFDNFLSNELNISGTTKEDRILIRNSTGIDLNTKDGDDSILVSNGYFINIYPGKGNNNVKCDNTSRTNIYLEKDSHNSVEFSNNYPESNNKVHPSYLEH